MQDSKGMMNITSLKMQEVHIACKFSWKHKWERNDGIVFYAPFFGRFLEITFFQYSTIFHPLFKIPTRRTKTLMCLMHIETCYFLTYHYFMSSSINLDTLTAFLTYILFFFRFLFIFIIQNWIYSRWGVLKK